MNHHLEHAVAYLVQLIQVEEHPEDMAAWAITALSGSLDIPVAVGVADDPKATQEMFEAALCNQRSYRTSP